MTATTTLGGKAGGGTATRVFVETRKTRLEEPFAPLGDDLARGIEARGNDVVGNTLGRIQDDLGAKDIPIR